MLPCINDPDLIFRGNTRINRDLFDLIRKLLIIHMVYFHSGNGKISLFKNTDLSGNGCGSNTVIACDHDSADTGGISVLYRFNGLLSRRIDH